nr:MAG TPA: ubiquinol cytochrome c oxidoreductase [Caudoviricetes sp.]
MDCTNFINWSSWYVLVVEPSKNSRSKLGC